MKILRRALGIACASMLLLGGSLAASSPATAAGGVDCGQAVLSGKFPNIDGDIIHSCSVTGKGAVVTYTVSCTAWRTVTVQYDWRSSASRSIPFDCPFPGAMSKYSVKYSVNPN